MTNLETVSLLFNNLILEAEQDSKNKTTILSNDIDKEIQNILNKFKDINNIPNLDVFNKSFNELKAKVEKEINGENKENYEKYVIKPATENDTLDQFKYILLLNAFNNKNFKNQKENKEQTNAPEELINKTDNVIDATSKLLTHINDDNFSKNIEKYKNMISSNQKAIYDWINKDVEKGETARFDLWSELDDKLGEYKKQIIPSLWRDSLILSVKDKFSESFNKYYFLSLLLEAEDSNSQDFEKIKSVIDDTLKSVVEIIKKDEKEFLDSYKNFVNKVNEIIKKLLENDKIKDQIEKIKDKDPFELLCLCSRIISNTNDDQSKHQDQEQST